MFRFKEGLSLIIKRLSLNSNTDFLRQSFDSFSVLISIRVERKFLVGLHHYTYSTEYSLG